MVLPRVGPGGLAGVSMPSRVLVTGAGGLIGHALVTYLKERGYGVGSVDLSTRDAQSGGTESEGRGCCLADE